MIKVEVRYLYCPQVQPHHVVHSPLDLLRSLTSYGASALNLAISEQVGDGVPDVPDDILVSNIAEPVAVTIVSPDAVGTGAVLNQLVQGQVDGLDLPLAVLGDVVSHL